MTSLVSPARGRGFRPSAEFSRPRLMIVPKLGARAPRIPFAILVVTVLAVGLVGLLLLNTALQSGAYRVTELKQTTSSLAIKQQNLRIKVASLRQPQRLAQQAKRLGMVRNDSPAFLSLSTGAVVGKAVPGLATNKVDVGRTGAPDPIQTGKQLPFRSGQQASGATPAERHRAAPDVGRQRARR